MLSWGTYASAGANASYVAFASVASAGSQLQVFPWNNGFGAKITTPTTTGGNGLATSFTNSLLALGTSFTPFVNLFDFSLPSDHLAKM